MLVYRDGNEKHMLILRAYPLLPSAEPDCFDSALVNEALALSRYMASVIRW